MSKHLLSEGRASGGSMHNLNKSGHTATAIMATPDKSAMTSKQPSSKPMDMGSSSTTTVKNPAGAGRPGGPSQTV